MTSRILLLMRRGRFWTDTLFLSRALAESGHFPAIDIEQSASRVMHNVVSQGAL